MRTTRTAKDVWLAFVIAGVRSKFGLTALALILVIAGWQFATRHIWTGLIILGIAVFTYARIRAAIGAALATRHERRNQ